MTRRIRRYLMLVTISASATSAFGAGAEVKSVDAVPEESEVRIEVELTSPVTPTIVTVDNPHRLIIEFTNVSLDQRQEIPVNKNGVNRVRVMGTSGSPLRTRIEVGIDAPRPYGITTIGNKFVLSILPRTSAARGITAKDNHQASITMNRTEQDKPVSEVLAAFSSSLPPEVEDRAVESPIAEAGEDTSPPARNTFKVKYVAGSTVYIDGGSNSGLRVGMTLAVRGLRAGTANVEGSRRSDAAIGSLRVVGVATTSAITEVSATKGEVKA
jgi:hypothetical protein